ncbi:SCO family protein [Vibrio sp.]|uniref:SCO family protein n=1 Tax=Vibrio sp. TaxID=678 RepID=UPI003D0BEC2E
MNRKWIALLAIAFLAGIGVNLMNNQPAETQVDSLASAETTILQGKNAQPVTLFDITDPRIRIVYFGFTRCPDVCPTSLAMLAGALQQLDTKLTQQLWPIFISLDPERDAPDAAHQYAQYFDSRIDGLSASLNITTPLAHKYGVIFRKTELENSELGYTLDHSSYFYFLEPDGTLITKVPHTLSPAPLVAAIQTVLKEGK